MNTLIKKELLGRGFDKNKIYLSSNGINFEYLDKIKKGEVSYDGIFLGRIDYSKGVLDLFDIWKKVCQKIPEAKLALIGGSDSEIKKSLIKKIKIKELEKNIEILGFLENEKAFSILKGSKVFLFPSHEEGWGIAVAEAMACNLPVVSWDLPVYREVFENYTVQIKEKDINLFSEKVIEILENDELRRKKSEEGKEFIKKYSWDNVAKREQEIIKI